MDPFWIVLAPILVPGWAAMALCLYCLAMMLVVIPLRALVRLSLDIFQVRSEA